MSVILIIVASLEKLQDLFLTRFWTTMSSRLASRAYSSAKIKNFSLVPSGQKSCSIAIFFGGWLSMKSLFLRQCFVSCWKFAT